MQINFERTGGYAGPAQRRILTMSAADLSADDLAKLRELLAAARGETPPAAERGRPDQFHYRVSIDDDGNQWNFDGGEAGAGATTRTLLGFLGRLGRKA